jgi:hypothetical protein
MIVKITSCGHDRAIECDSYRAELLASKRHRWTLTRNEKVVFDDIVDDGGQFVRIYVMEGGKTVDKYTYEGDKVEGADDE